MKHAIQLMLAANAAFGKARGKNKGKGKGKGKGKVVRSNLTLKQRRDKLRALKAKSKCLRCGGTGHWAGDPEVGSVMGDLFELDASRGLPFPLDWWETCSQVQADPSNQLRDFLTWFDRYYLLTDGDSTVELRASLGIPPGTYEPRPKKSARRKGLRTLLWRLSVATARTSPIREVRCNMSV